MYHFYLHDNFSPISVRLLPAFFAMSRRYALHVVANNKYLWKEGRKEIIKEEWAERRSHFPPLFTLSYALALNPRTESQFCASGPDYSASYCSNYLIINCVRSKEPFSRH